MNFRKTTNLIIMSTAFFAVVILVLFLTKTTNLNPHSSINTQIFADYGVLVGGIATAVLTILNIYLLIHTLSEQRRNFDRTQIESRFFELLKIHRKNSEAIIIKERSGNKVLLSLLRELDEAREVVKAASGTRKKMLTEIDELNIAYLCFFFGAVGKHSESVLRENLKRYNLDEDNGFLNTLFTFFLQRQTSACTFDYKIFQGHQSRLGHYFRQLFQLVKYINNKPMNILSYKDKSEYIRTLRAQLSTPEQVLFFFNSLSDLGKPWEKEEGLTDNQMLITKYNLIKNIPRSYIKDIDIRKFYPNVNYEDLLNKTVERQNLEKLYF